MNFMSQTRRRLQPDPSDLAMKELEDNPVPTIEDKAQAAAFIDAWFARDTTLCPIWKRINRAALIASHAVTVMGERMRRRAA